MTVDRGSSWRPAGRGLPAVVPGWAPLALAGDPTRSGAIYAATGKGLYATTNSGRSWKRSLACATLWASANAGAEWKSVGAARWCGRAAPSASVSSCADGGRHPRS